MAREAIPPPYFITADDKRGLIVVTVALVLAFVYVCSLIRVSLRWQSGDWRADDWLLSIATVLYTVQSGIVFHLVKLGLGASLDGVPLLQLERLGKEGIASQIFYICTQLFSKLSVLFLYLRLSISGTHRVLSYGVAAASIVWAVMAVVLIVVPCNPMQYYTAPQLCTNRWSKWQAISSLDIVTEALIFGIAVQLVWTLQMRMRAKLIVIFAFSARLPVIALAILRLYYLHQHFLGTSTTFEYIVATQWQMGYAIMASTITGMGPFLRPFNKGYASYQQKSAYGHGSVHMPTHSRIGEALDRSSRNSWQSEGYLMQSLPSRRGSKITLPDSIEPSMLSKSPDKHVYTPSTSSTAEPEQSRPSSQVNNRLTADANFQPVDCVSKLDTEIWVGNRAASFGNEDSIRPNLREERGMVINKRTQLTVEVDRASRVV